MTTQRKKSAAIARAFLGFTLLYAVGCAEKEENFPKIGDSATQVEGKERNSEKDAVGENTKNGENRKDGGDKTGVADSDAAELLGGATERFVDIFGEEGAKEETVGFDETLVDEETRQKYAADRTTVAPTLAPRTDEAGAAERPKYRLEYKFQPNTSLRWNVVHQVRKKVSYAGKETTTETSSTAFRRWDFGERGDDGKLAARHEIDRMILRQNEEGKEPIDFDSERDLVVPKEIAAFGTEKAIGVVLETFDINPCGVMSDKKKLVAEYQGREGDSNVLVPFPTEEVAVGDVWTVPYALYLKGGDEVVRPYRVVERFRLESVDEKFATISFTTTLMSIVDDPVVEGALAERLFSGRALFDRERGLTLRTELTFNRRVANAFGFSSYLEYNCQVVEKLIRDDEPTQAAQTGESTAVAEPAQTGESAAVAEPAQTEESAAVAEPAQTGESAAVAEPAQMGESAAVAEPAQTGESTAVAEPAQVGESAAVEEPAN
ncbi:MAG: hypothetical protein J6K25_02255 [Thermoguttaceae bacterium]|nr:hypothetical protein [Thermoguttaceae bacterium]